MFRYNFDDPQEFKEAIETDTLFLRFLAKKFVAQGDSLRDLSLSISKDLDYMVKVFILYPLIEEAFYKLVSEISEAESEKLKPQAVAGAMRQINDILTGKTMGTEIKDIVACAKAILVYSSVGKRRDGPDDPFEKIFQEAQAIARSRANGDT